MNIASTYNRNRFRLEMTKSGPIDWVRRAMEDKHKDYLETVRSVVSYANPRIQFYNWADALDGLFLETWELHKAIGKLHEMNHPTLPLRYVQFHSEERDHWVELVFAPHLLFTEQKETRIRYYIRQYTEYRHWGMW